MLNNIVIQGRLVRKPELRYTYNNTATTTVTLACERDYAPQGQQRVTDFIDCVIWRQTAEFVEKYFNKGDMMMATGRLQFREWEDRDGNKRRNAEILVDHVYFGSSKRESSSGSDQQSAVREEPEQFTEMDDDDGELPF